MRRGADGHIPLLRAEKGSTPGPLDPAVCADPRMQDAWELWAELGHSVEGRGLCSTGTPQRVRGPSLMGILIDLEAQSPKQNPFFFFLKINVVIIRDDTESPSSKTKQSKLVSGESFALILLPAHQCRSYELSSRVDKLIQNLPGSNLLVFPFFTEKVALYANCSEFAFFTYLRESFCFNI